MIRVLIRYETGEYKVEKIPIDNISKLGLTFLDRLTKILDTTSTEENLYYFDFLTENISFYTLRSNTNFIQNRVVFFRNLIPQANPLSKILPVPGPLFDKDIRYIKCTISKTEH
ncbi:hypothetical protein EXW28_07735 [Bacillus mycoides]|uniref:hypothetical protein n=1 Tax=Bacillus mycoides TaxID=1405 RepID=UPI001C0202D7|nr:hypothetical protein [Bacillus mycoides]QWG49753.1 hypothetical protein EXW37_07735 [Bacillus mycoides]QWH33558.1 hypothetical protein EXW28_07735 [Bacillus mycoides]